METNFKEPISKEQIYKTMLGVTYAVSAVFLLKNLITREFVTALIIGLLLVAFGVVLFVMSRRNAAEEKQQLFVCLSLHILIFIISLFSGESFSDDFLIHLAAIGLAGLYLRPRQTALQTILSFVLLIVQSFICPEKMGGIGQYILCLAVYTLAAILIYLTIKRGRAFIMMAHARSEEAEELIGALKKVSEELKVNFNNSTAGIEGLRKASRHLDSNADELKLGSDSISIGTREVSNTCDDAQMKLQETEKQVDTLTKGVHDFEEILDVNKENMRTMNHQMESVRSTMKQTNDVFALFTQYMLQISSVTEQLNKISSNTKMLALNASIEAARAGQTGAGFAVVASKVQDLAVDSSKCSEQVAEVVCQMQKQIQTTTEQIVESGEMIHSSLDTLKSLQDSFERLTTHFDSLYRNIESQNNNINQVDSIFEQLKARISEMNQYSEENKNAVDSIASAMEIYRESMEHMIADTENVHKLSEEMMSMTE
ncbi:MAG: methyl-accepting chemotaxis protein [Lachnospiraceae bacterium]